MAAMRSFSEASHRPDSRPSFSLLRILQRNRGKYIQTPGCNFTVTTNSPGLRVFWSGAYWISPRYFGHPTSPTLSVLQSGTYIFGVAGGRSDERRVGKEGVSTCRYRWAPYL